MTDKTTGEIFGALEAGKNVWFNIDEMKKSLDTWVVGDSLWGVMAGTDAFTSSSENDYMTAEK